MLKKLRACFSRQIHIRKLCTWIWGLESNLTRCDPCIENVIVPNLQKLLLLLLDLDIQTHFPPQLQVWPFALTSQSKQKLHTCTAKCDWKCIYVDLRIRFLIVQEPQKSLFKLLYLDIQTFISQWLQVQFLSPTSQSTALHFSVVNQNVRVQNIKKVLLLLLDLHFQTNFRFDFFIQNRIQKEGTHLYSILRLKKRLGWSLHQFH